MQKGNTCCVTGPRAEYLPPGATERGIKKKLEAEIRKLVTYDGVTGFYVGMEPGVCQWAAEVILQLKNIFPGIKLHCVLSCETLADNWTEPQRDRFYAVMEHCDEEWMLQGAYTPDCERRCARYLIRHNDLLLAVWNDVEISGAGYALHLAQAAGKEIRLIRIEASGRER